MGGRNSRKRPPKSVRQSRQGLASKSGTPGKAAGLKWQDQVKAFRTAARDAGWAEERITTTLAQGRSAVIAAQAELE